MSSVAGERTLILLRYIIENDDGLSIREASRSLGYSPATVQKLIGSLFAQGFVVKDDLTDRYQLGPEAIRLGFAALARLDIRRSARPYLEALSEKTGETIFLAIRRGNHAIYIDKVVSRHPIRMDAPLGVNRPYNCTAAGKILLLGMLPQDIEQMAKEGYFEASTSNSIADPAQLTTEVEKIRQVGWSEDKEEFVIGAYCVAAPIHDFNGEVIAAVTITGPTQRILANLDNFITQVKANALEISRELGYSKK